MSAERAARDIGRWFGRDATPQEQTEIAEFIREETKCDKLAEALRAIVDMADRGLIAPSADRSVAQARALLAEIDAPKPNPESPERAALRGLVALSHEMIANRYLLQSRLIPEYEREAFQYSCGMYRDALAHAEAVLNQPEAIRKEEE